MITKDRTLLVGLTTLMLTFGGCVVSIGSPDRDYLPKSQWATIDGDRGYGTENENENENIYGRHRVMTMNGHDLRDGRNPRLKEQKKVDCLLRDCKLYPGQHSILVEYRWDSMENEKKKRRRDGWKGLGYGLLFIGGIMGGAQGGLVAPDGPDDPVYPCEAEVDFEVQARRDYTLRIIHTEVYTQPEEFQIVDKASGSIVGSAQPSCN